MDQLMLDEFTEIQVRKQANFSRDYTSSEGIRDLIQNVIADTYLLLSGDVPMEQWKTDEGWPVPKETTLEPDYWETAE